MEPRVGIHGGGSLRLAGLVLAGGRSRRFGSEKAVALFRGRPMMDWPLAALAAVCEAVAVSARGESGAAAVARERGLAVLADGPAVPEGPLAGITAGVAWAREGGFSHLATLPCDTPGIGETVLRRLIAEAGRGGAFAVTPGGAEPLVAVWPVIRFPRPDGAHPPIQSLLHDLGALPVRFQSAALFANVNRAAASNNERCDQTRDRFG